MRLTGFAAHPSHTRSHPRMQYVFLNGRAIRDRALQHALSEAYRGLILTGRYPIAFLRIEMPPAAVDVNVHPTKLEVRFQDSGRLYSQLLGTLRTKFLTIDLTTKFRAPASFGASSWRQRGPSGRTPRTKRPRCKNGKSWWLGRRESWRGRNQESGIRSQGSGVRSRKNAAGRGDVFRGYRPAQTVGIGADRSPGDSAT